MNCENTNLPECMVEFPDEQGRDDKGNDPLATGFRGQIDAPGKSAIMTLQTKTYEQVS